MAKNNKGFTLTELIVVMGIIALLSALGIAGIIIAKRSAANSQRTVAAQEVETALAGYAAKNHGKYLDQWGFSGLVDTLLDVTGANGKKYMEERPKGIFSYDGVVTDGSENQHYVYYPYSTGGHYILAACAVDAGAFPDRVGQPWGGEDLAKWMNVVRADGDYSKATKADVTNCSNVVYFVNK